MFIDHDFDFISTPKNEPETQMILLVMRGICRAFRFAGYANNWL